MIDFKCREYLHIKMLTLHLRMDLGCGLRCMNNVLRTYPTAYDKKTVFNKRRTVLFLSEPEDCHHHLRVTNESPRPTSLADILDKYAHD